MKLLLISLGCDKNLVDSEKMLGALTAGGYELTDDEQEAEIAVINTCCFIEDAKKESIETIFELTPYKEAGTLKAIIVTGCMAQRYREEIEAEIPEVDAIVGTTGYDEIVAACDAALSGRHTAVVKDASTDPAMKEKRVVTTGGFFAYLKIAEGCDKHCTYCAIPKMRGSYRSFPMEELLAEARDLADRGVRELILVAQETTLYGTDLYGRKCLHELLRKLVRIEGIRWIRLLYCYPEEIYPELIDVIAEEPKICHYLDLPIQSASDTVLRRMNRKTDRQELRELILTLRERIPDIVLRTTLITGFPGETEEEHEETLRFVEEMRFDRLGVFLYSKEEGTPAERMHPQIRKYVKKRRMNEIMKLQQKISLEKNEARIGEELEAFVEGALPEEGVCVTRTYGDAPQVDGCLFLNTERTLMTGDIVRVRVTGASEYDLIGELAEEEEEDEFL